MDEKEKNRIRKILDHEVKRRELRKILNRKLSQKYQKEIHKNIEELSCLKTKYVKHS